MSVEDFNEGLIVGYSIGGLDVKEGLAQSNFIQDKVSLPGRLGIFECMSIGIYDSVISIEEKL